MNFEKSEEGFEYAKPNQHFAEELPTLPELACQHDTSREGAPLPHNDTLSLSV